MLAVGPHAVYDSAPDIASDGSIPGVLRVWAYWASGVQGGIWARSWDTVDHVPFVEFYRVLNFVAYRGSGSGTFRVYSQSVH